MNELLFTQRHWKSLTKLWQSSECTSVTTNNSVKGPFMLSQMAIRLHLAESKAERSLSIVNISSISGHKSISLGSVYSMSKHALSGMTKNIATEYAGQGIRCNSVSPVSLGPESRFVAK